MCRPNQERPRSWIAEIGPLRYAVVFGTHVWDDFVARQYARLRARCRPEDLYVVTDDTARPWTGCALPNRLPITFADIERLIGRVPRVRGVVGLDSVVWWNLDVMGYRLFDACPHYDYCLVVDYDSWINVELDGFLSAVARNGQDFVAHHHSDIPNWSWAGLHAPPYPVPELRGALLGVTVLSRKAASYLALKRRFMAAEFRAGRLACWPFCEAFMPTELARAGFRIGDLREHGDASRFRWRPIYPEDQVLDANPAGFLHPVRPGDQPSTPYSPV